MVRVILLLGSLAAVVACGAPLRQVPPALDPANPDAPESAPPLPIVRSELPPVVAPTPKAAPITPAPPMHDMPAGHHMHHLSPQSPPAAEKPPMDHSLHGAPGAGQ